MQHQKNPAGEKTLWSWNDKQRGAPSAILRSSVFSAVRHGNRTSYETATELTALSSISAKGRGPQLDQADLDTWLMALHLARLEPLGTVITFSAKSFLANMDRADGKSDRDWLTGSLKRLSAFYLHMSVEKKSGKTGQLEQHAYEGTLLQSFAVDAATGRLQISLSPALANLFMAGLTRLDWGTRQRLRGKQLALWLSAFYATHKNPYAFKAETLQHLTGSRADAYGFKRLLLRALSECRSAGAIGAYLFPNDDGLVEVNHTPRPTPQQRQPNRRALTPGARRLQDAEPEGIGLEWADFEDFEDFEED